MYQTRPKASTTAPAMPTPMPAFATATPFSASAKAGSPAGRAHSRDPIEQAGGTCSSPRPRSTPPTAAPATPMPATTRGTLDRLRDGPDDSGAYDDAGAVL